MRHRLRSAICIAVVGLAGMVAAGAGCSNQGEGERCTFFPNGSESINGSTPTNGTQDCQDGLVCEQGTNFPTATGTYDRCCPPDQANATVQACMTGSVVGGDQNAGRDASFEDSAADAAPDAKDEDAKKADAKSEDAKTEDVESKDAASEAEPADAANGDAGNDGSAESSADASADSSPDSSADASSD